MPVDPRAAHICKRIFQIKPMELIRSLEDFDRLSHHFITNAVTGQYRYLCHAGSFISCISWVRIHLNTPIRPEPNGLARCTDQ